MNFAENDGQRRLQYRQEGVVPYRRSAAALPMVVEPQPSYDDEGGGLDLRRILHVLLRWKWLILAVALLGLGASALLTLTQTPLYRASATLEVQRQETRIIEGGDVEPATIADAEHMATQYELLRSRALSERVAEVLDLPSDEKFVDPEADRAQRLAQATNVIQEGLQIAPVARSRIIDVRFVSPNSRDAARIANALAENFIEMTLERRYNATAYARRFLDERLETTKAALEAAERSLIQYSKDKEILDLSSVGGSEIGSSLDASSLVALNASLSEAEEQRLTAELKYNEARDSAATREILDNEAIRTLRAGRAQLVAEYQEKLAKFKPEYPEMRELKARTDALDREIAMERRGIVDVLESEYKAALAREAALRLRVEELKYEVQDLRGRSIEYNILAREVDTQRSQYEALLQRSKEVGIASGIGSSQIAIVDRAQPPAFPFDPDIRSALMRGLILSLALGIGLAFLIEYIDDSIKTPEDVKSKLGVPVIGVIPKLRGAATVAQQITDPKSEVAEAFSSTRTALQFSSPSGAPKSLLVTGSKPSEGKTSSTLALAFAFAGVGKRVLIIDADMRRPSYASAPGASIGLSGVLTQETPLGGEIVRGAAANIFLLPAGIIPPNPAELLSGPRLAEVLEEACGMFDVVIVDSPPVLDFADAPALSSACDATLLVLQSGGVRTPAAKRTIERLLNANANLVGVLLTKFNVKNAGYGYGYTYQYGYNYRYQGKKVRSEANARRKIHLFSEDGDPASRPTEL